MTRLQWGQTCRTHHFLFIDDAGHEDTRVPRMTEKEVMIQEEAIALFLVTWANGIEILILGFFGKDASTRLQKCVTDLFVSMACSDEQVRDQGRLPFVGMSGETDETDQILFVHDVRFIFDDQNGDEDASLSQLVGVFVQRMLKGRFDLVLQLGDSIGEKRGDQHRRNDERVEQTSEEKDRSDNAQKKKKECIAIAKTSTRDRSENLDAFFCAQPLNVQPIGGRKVSNGIRRSARFTFQDAGTSNFHLIWKKTLDRLIRHFGNKIVQRIHSWIQHLNDSIEKRIEFLAGLLALLFLFFENDAKRLPSLMRTQFVDQMMNVDEEQFDLLQFLLAKSETAALGTWSQRGTRDDLQQIEIIRQNGERELLQFALVIICTHVDTSDLQIFQWTNNRFTMIDSIHICTEQFVGTLNNNEHAR